MVWLGRNFSICHALDSLAVIMSSERKFIGIRSANNSQDASRVHVRSSKLRHVCCAGT